jgi:hypothetical protein
VTVSLANGKTEQWVMDRAGHKSSPMIALYARQARTRAELNLGPLLPLDMLLAEMRRKASQRGPSTQPASHAPAPRRGADSNGPRLGHALLRPLDSTTTGRSAAQSRRREESSKVLASCQDRSSDCWTRTSDPAVNSPSRWLAGSWDLGKTGSS